MMPFEIQITEAANRNTLPVAMVSALIQVESDFKPFAWKPEPPYRWFWDLRRNAPFRPTTEAENKSEDAPSDFPTLAGHRNQEWWAQQASWGLMQIMGAVARERGYRGEYLPELTRAEVNLHYGCLHLAHLRTRFFAAHGWSGVLAAYNTGGPLHGLDSDGERYVTKIRAIWSE